ILIVGYKMIELRTITRLLVLSLPVWFAADARSGQSPKLEPVFLEGSSEVMFLPTFSGDGKLVAAYRPKGRGEMGFSEMKIWDVATGRERARIPANLASTRLAFGCDGARLATVIADNSVRIWDGSGKEVQRLRPSAEISVALALADKDRLAV